jgi:hypothetical protein
LSTNSIFVNSGLAYEWSSKIVLKLSDALPLTYKRITNFITVLVLQFSFDSDGEGDTENMNTTVQNFTSDDEKYEFATHVIKVRRSGQVSGVQSLWELEGINKTFYIVI